MFHHTGLIGTVVIGLVIGIIAKLLMPGRDPGGCLVTMLLGLGGSIVGTILGRFLFGHHYHAHWIGSIVGAMVILAIHRIIVHRRL